MKLILICKRNITQGSCKKLNFTNPCLRESHCSENFKNAAKLCEIFSAD